MKGLRRMWFSLTLLVLFQSIAVHAVVMKHDFGEGLGSSVRLVKKEERTEIASTDYGSISAADIDLGGTQRRRYHLQFISMDQNSLFLPAVLHSHTLLYVDTGNGTLSYTDGDEVKATNVAKGEVYTLKSGSIFYIQSFKHLQIFALFSNAIAGQDLQRDTWAGPYTGILDLFQGIDARILQEAFQAPEDVIEEIMSAGEMPPIVEAGKVSSHKKDWWGKGTVFVKTFLEMNEFTH